MRNLALYWNVLVEMFRDPVDPEAARQAEGAEPSSLSVALAQIGLVGGGAAGAEARGR